MAQRSGHDGDSSQPLRENEGGNPSSRALHQQGGKNRSHGGSLLAVAERRDQQTEGRGHSEKARIRPQIPALLP